MSEERRPDAPLHNKPKHNKNDVSFNYSGNLGNSLDAKYDSSYVTMTISFSHTEPTEVIKARNLFETKALELRELFRKSNEV